jgi:hypothetical protein
MRFARSNLGEMRRDDPSVGQSRDEEESPIVS